MNQSSTLYKADTVTLPEWMENNPFVDLFRRKIRQKNANPANKPLKDLDEDGYKLAIAFCDDSRAKCSIKETIEFRAIQREPSLRVIVIINDTSLTLTMNREGNRDLMHDDGVIALKWPYIVILFESFCEFIELARKK